MKCRASRNNTEQRRIKLDNFSDCQTQVPIYLNGRILWSLIYQVTWHIPLDESSCTQSMVSRSWGSGGKAERHGTTADTFKQPPASCLVSLMSVFISLWRGGAASTKLSFIIIIYLISWFFFFADGPFPCTTKFKDIDDVVFLHEF